MLKSSSTILSKLVVIIFVLFGLLLFYQKFEIASYPYHADENDYAESINKGLLTNYLDLNAPGAWSYLSDAFNAYLNGEDIDTFQKFQDSIHNKRHYHGAIAFYPFVILKTLLPNLDLRLVPIILILIFSTYWLFINLEQTLLQKATFLLITVLLLCYSQLNLLISPHLTYLFITLIFLDLIGRNYKGKKLLLPVICLVFAFSSLEFALILPIVWILTIWQTDELKLKQIDIKELIINSIKIAVIFLLTLLIFWPGGLLKLAMPLSYIVYAALALKSDWYQFYTTLIFKDWLLTILLISCLLSSIIYILFMKKLNLGKSYVGFAWYVVLMFLINLLNNFVYKAYLIQTIVPGLIIILLLLAQFLPKISRFNLEKIIFVPTLLVLVLIFQLSIKSNDLYLKEMKQSNELISFIGNNYSSNSLIVIGYNPIISNINFPNQKIVYYPESKEYNLACKSNLLPENRMLIVNTNLIKEYHKIECLGQNVFSKQIKSFSIYYKKTI